MPLPSESASPFLAGCIGQNKKINPLMANGGMVWLSLISRESPSIRQKQASLQTFTRHDDVIPVFWRALITAWTLEQAEQSEIKHVWHPYQDALTYALGRLEAFGALTNIIIPTSHLHRWTVTLTYGSLQARERFGDLLSQVQTNSTLKEEIAQVLERRFGLSAGEQGEYLDGYTDAYFG